MKNICLITCYMGPLPNYFGYYVASCKKNPTIDFIVINDSIFESYIDKNISFIKMNLEELNHYSSHQLNTTIKLANAWKINELKPLFGNILKEHIAGYDFWGWCDLDIIWGNLRHFLNESVLSEFDAFTTKEFWSAGHFTLFKNNELCNNLYKRYPEIIALLNDPTYFAFEECCHRWNGKIFSFESLQKQGLPISMFDIIKNAESNGELKAHFKDIIREHPQHINYTYKNGILTDLIDHKEFMYYHLITVKKIWRFYIPTFQKNYNSLIMTPYGIRDESENKLSWALKRAYYCFLGIRKSARTQSIGTLIKKLFRFKYAEN